MELQRVILKPGKEKALKNHHHWIFSGAVEKSPKFESGSILPVYSQAGDCLGSAYFNPKAKIFGRMVCFDETHPLEAIRKHLDDAVAWRESWFNPTKTNAYRLVNGEGDRIPGLIVDKYDGTLVIQISTLGMEKLRPFIVDYLVQRLNPKAIYEKSNLPSRKEEGLQDVEGILYGHFEDEVVIIENGLKFVVPIKEGQKTGFFLDHREMRQQIREISAGKKVLNCFSYTGGFSIYAAAGEALVVDSVDISAKALGFAKKSMELNQHIAAHPQYYAEDVFTFLRENPLQYNIVILDPPAFAKRQKDIIPACRGYKDINRIALQKMPPKSFLLTSSCSYHVDAELFQKVVFQASREANRNANIIGRHRLAPDHPLNLCHPEGDYLKSLLLYVE